MKKSISLGLLLILSIGFVLAAQGDVSGNQEESGNTVTPEDNQIIGGDRDENGCLTSAGYSWNTQEEKCVREWETGEARYQDMEQNQNTFRVENGEYISENGQTFRVQAQENNKVKIESGGIEAECECNMSQEKNQNKTKLTVAMSNGRNAEIKIMPNTASETALERLRLKVCTEERGCLIELKEVGKENETRMAYEVQIERHSRILGIFQKKMKVKAEVEAETGEVIDVDKPWWAFIATEPKEE